MARSVDLVVRILGDSKGAQRAADQAAGRFGKLESGIGKLAKPAAAVVLGLAGVGIASVKAASDLEQSQGAVAAVFGKSQGAVVKFSETSATRMGLATSAYQNYAALTGTALQNAGFSAGQAATETDKLMQQAADNAALYGGTTSEAVEAINAAVARSEFDPLEKYGVSLKMSSVNAELAKRGQDKLTGAALDNAKAQIILSEIYGKGSKAQGQYAREAGSVAGRTETAKAQITNMAASLGTALLPVVSEGARILGTLAGVITDNEGVVQGLAVGIGALATAVLLANGAFKVYHATTIAIQAVQKAWAAIQLALTTSTASTAVGVWALTAAEKARTIATTIGTAATNGAALAMRLLNAAWLASPWGVVIAGILLLVGAFILAYNKSETFRNIVQAVLRAVSAAASATGAWLKAAFSAAWGVIQAGARIVGSVVSAIFRAVSTVARVVASAIGAVFRTYFNIVSAIVRAWGAVISAIFRAALAVGRSVASGIGAVFRAGFTVISAVGRSMGSAVRAVFSAVGSVARSVASAVGAVFRATFAAAATAGRVMGSAVRAVFSAIGGPVRALASLIRGALGGALRTVTSIGRGVGGAITGGLSAVTGVINRIVGAVRNLIGWISRIRIPKISLPFGLGGPPAGATGQARTLALGLGAPTSPTVTLSGPGGRDPFGDLLRSVSAARGGAATQVVTINVTGALDPDAVARQIRSLLTRADRRGAGVRIAGALA